MMISSADRASAKVQIGDATRIEAATQLSAVLSIETPGPAFLEITREVQSWLGSNHATHGLLTLFIRHTSASLTIQENADPEVLGDLTTALDRLAPQSASWRHDCEGPDDMPAHIKTMLTANSLTIPVRDGRAMLGTWQGIYVAEHRARPHQRTVIVHFSGALRN